jgi:hypothetical protein
MAGNRCMHELPIDQCGECRRPPPGLTKRVIITHGGQVFHHGISCPSLREGQRYAARRGDEVHEPIFVSLTEAQSENRAACATCFPDYHPGKVQAETARDRGFMPPDSISSVGNHAEFLDQLAAALHAARNSVSAALAAEVDRGRLTDLVARALIDIRAQVWPNAAPVRLDQQNREAKP